MSNLVQIDPQAYFFWALLLLLLPLKWLLAAFFSALVHEISHIFVLKIQGGTIYRIHVHWNGCVIEADRGRQTSDFCSILAGPLGSLSLLFLYRIAPQIAVCGLIQGAYNLIPLMPLDGGRLFHEILYRICPERTQIIMQGTESVLRIGIVTGILIMMNAQRMSLLPGLMLVIWNIRAALRKIPCKP